MTFIRNRWYIAAWDGEVANAPLSRKICGETIVLYRKLNGSVVALSRCLSPPPASSLPWHSRGGQPPL